MWNEKILVLNVLFGGKQATLTLCHDTKPSNKTTTRERQHTRIARRGPCASSPPCAPRLTKCHAVFCSWLPDQLANLTPYTRSVVAPACKFADVTLGVIFSSCNSPGEGRNCPRGLRRPVPDMNQRDMGAQAHLAFNLRPLPRTLALSEWSPLPRTRRTSPSSRRIRTRATTPSATPPPRAAAPRY